MDSGPNPSLDNSEQHRQHSSVADKLERLRHVQDLQRESVASEVERPASEPQAELAITTVDDYLATELDTKLERIMLAKRYHQLAQLDASKGVVYRRDEVRTRPDWGARFPADDSDEQIAQWEAFLADFPRDMQVSLRGLEANSRRLKAAHEDMVLMAEVQADKTKNLEARQAAILFGALRRKQERIEKQNRNVRWLAADLELPLSSAQLEDIESSEAQKDALKEIEAMAFAGLSSEQREEAKQHVMRLSVLRDRAALRNGLIETSQMEAIVDRHLASLLAGGRLLLVGETGGAKTALAKHIAMETQRLLGRKPPSYEFVSAYGDINAYQLIGKQELVKQDDVTVTKFALGAISRAMVDGRPLIIDEINAMPNEVSKRLNEILLLKPGASYTLQENGGQTITIKEGFCVIGTANEKSHRYKGVEEMSAELRNRFAATTERVPYPDANVLPGEPPVEMTRVAMAALADTNGNIPFEQYGLTAESFLNLLKAAHVSQRLFSEPASVQYSLYVNESQIRDGKPGLDKEVISPRMLIAILESVRQSGGSNTLEDVLGAYINGIPENSLDRRVITKLLENYNLIDNPAAAAA